MRKALVLLGLFAATTSLAVFAEKDAAACGGCFHPPNENPSVITDHRMILSVSPQQTTLYDQIRYQGSPSSFAWVLPINGVATVGLSADVVFQTLDNLSATQVIPPADNCPPPPSCPGVNYGGAAGDASSSADAGVVVSHEKVVGPYETVQLHSSDPNALNNWLTSHGFAVPADVAPIIAAYVNEHFDFLAMKLVPGAGVGAMRPVRVSTPGASPLLPLRMVAAGTGATVGVTLWVVADGRYETANFPWFRIDDREIVWDWAQNRSNYTTLRAQKTAAGGGRVWEIESSLPADANSIRSQVQYGSQPQYPYDDAGVQYPPVPPGDGAAGESSDQLMKADLDTLFTGLSSSTFRLTRLRADLAHAALATDLNLTASADQSVASNVRRPTATNGSPQCPSPPPCGDYPPNYDGGIGVDPGGTVTPNDGHAESFNCQTSPALGGDSVVTLAGLAGFVGFSLFRSRRRRRS